MTGHALAAVKDLHGGAGDLRFHLRLRELVGHAVPVMVDLHVIVDIDAADDPVSKLVTLRPVVSKCSKSKIYKSLYSFFLLHIDV